MTSRDTSWSRGASGVEVASCGRIRRPPAPALSRFVMPWGKYKGVPVEQIPDGYLAWGLTEADFYGAVKAALVHEWQLRADRRRSWRPVARAKWGRRVLGVLGQGPFAVCQPCGGLSIALYPTLEEARAQRRADCGHDGGNWGCQAALHYVFDLRGMREIRSEAIDLDQKGSLRQPSPTEEAREMLIRMSSTP